jgi:hypothetical protein
MRTLGEEREERGRGERGERERKIETLRFF